ncbi:YadA-like family protein [Pasteurellaceae bacterium TAE3-ERU1]|nr:YadA-like family protein [Pasteurellaceae bacterium TAE3-ERU1]
MNKIYKVIYNKSAQSYVAVSELARGVSHTLSSSRKNKKERKTRKILFSPWMFSTIALLSVPVHAYVAIGGTGNDGKAVENAGDLWIMGALKREYAEAANSFGHMALNYYNPGNMTYRSAGGIPSSRYSGDLSAATGIAIGAMSTAIVDDKYRQSNQNGQGSSGIAIGDYSRATGPLSFALGSYSIGEEVGATAIGTASRASGFNSLAMMRQSAATDDYAMAIGTVAWAAGKGSLAMGQSATAKGARSIAIGSADVVPKDGSSTAMVSAYSDESNTQATGRDAIAFGSSARAMADSAIAEGLNATAITTGSIAVGANSVAGLTDSNWQEAVVPVTVGVRNSSGTTINYVKGEKFKSAEDFHTFLNMGRNGIGWQSENDKTVAQDFIRSNQGHANNIAIGESAVAYGGRNVSIGEKAGAAKGDKWDKTFKDTALEKQINEDNWNIHNVNVGTYAGANSKKDFSVAIGYEAGALSEDVAKEQRSIHNGKDMGGRSPSVLIGKEAGKDSITYGTVAIGDGAGAGMRLNTALETEKQDSKSNVFLGTNAGAGVKTNNGYVDHAKDNGAGSNIGIGTGALQTSVGDANIALGLKAGQKINGDENTVIGNFALAGGDFASTTRNVIIGNQATIASGSGKENWDKNVLIGDYANGNSTGFNLYKAVGIGGSTQSRANYGTTLGADSKVDVGAEYATALGSYSHVESAGVNGIAAGHGATVKAKDAIAQGTSAVAEGESAIAMGNGAKAKGEKSIAIGTGNEVTGAKSGAIGDPSTVSGTGSYSIGNDNSIPKDNTFVLGNNVTATQDNSVILGNASADKAAKAVTEATVNGINYGGFAGTGNASYGVVSVAKAGAERQIVNVAPGEISASSTDAINGSQLWNVLDKGGITFANGTNVSDGKSDQTALVKFGDTVKFDGKGDIKVDFDATNKTYTISGPTTQPQVTVPTYTVGADKNNSTGGITLNSESNNQRVDIVGKADGAIETSVSGRNVEIDLKEGTKKEIEKIAQGTKYKGDYGNTGEASTSNEFTRKLGDTTTVKGGAKYADLTDNNIGVVSDGTSVLTVKLAKALTGLESAVFTKDGNTTTVDGNGVTINDGPKIVKNGIDAGNKKITHVAKGTEGTDAVNKSQLDEAVAGAKGKPTSVVGKDNITVTKKVEKNDQGGDEYEVTLKDNVRLTENGMISISDKTVLDKDGIATPKVQTGKTSMEAGKVMGLDDRDPDSNANDYGQGENATRAATEGAVKVVKDGVDAVNAKVDQAKFGLKAEDGKTVEKLLNNTIDIVGADSNITTKVDDGKVKVALSKTLTDLTSADFKGTDGASTKVDGDKILSTHKDGGIATRDGNETRFVGGDNDEVALSNNGLDNGNNKIVNVAAGEDDTDAVNVSQLKPVKEAVEKGLNFEGDYDSAGEQLNNTFNRKLGSAVSITGEADHENLTDGNIGVVSNGEDGLAVKLSKKLDLGEGGEVKMTNAAGDQVTLNGDGFELSPKVSGGDQTPIKITKEGIDAGNHKVTGVTDGKISDDSKDAVNGSQLHATNTRVDTLESGWNLTTGADGGKAEGTTVAAIKATNTVTVKAGKNIAIKQADKDITIATASEVEFDKVTTGPVVISKDDGINAGNRKITGVDTGTEDTDAVNVKQLKDAVDAGSYNFTVSDKDGAKTAVAKGKDVKFQGTDGVTVKRTGEANEDQKFEIGLGNDVKIGKDGAPGKMGINGADGQPAIALDGEDGSIGLKGKDGANGKLTVAKGADGLDGTNGKDGKDRLKVNGEDVATMGDGLKFTGNDDKQVIAKKLNQTLQVKGGAGTDAQVTDKNTRVDVESGALVVKLAKDLTDLNSVTVGTGDKEVKVDGTNGNITVGGSNGTKIEKGKVTGLDARDPVTNKDDYGTGENANRAATESAVKGVNDKVVTNTNNITELQEGWKLEATKSTGDVEGGKEVAVKAKEKVEIDAGKNIKLTQTDKKISIATKDEVEFKSINLKDGNNETKLTTTANGLDVGGDKITNVGTGIDDSDAVNVAQLTKAIADNAYGFTVSDNGTDKKAVAKGKDVAFKGADKGGIVVTRSGEDNADQTFEFKLDKDVTVGDKTNPGTITVKGKDGKDGVSIKGEDGSIGLTGPTGENGKDGVTTIKVVAGDTGLDGKDGTNGKDGKDAKKPRLEVNGEQVATLKDGLKFKGNGEKTVDKKLNETVTIKGGMEDLTNATATAKNTRVDVDDDGNLVVKLAKELQDLDKVVVGAEPGKDGNDGKPGVALDGKDGKIGIAGKDGTSADITVKNGQPGVDGQPGKDGKNPRLEVGGKEIATLDDGLKYQGDFNTASAVKLNKETTLTGEVGSKAEADFTTGNIAVVADDDNSTDSAKLTLKLAKDLTGLTSVTTTDADGNTTVQNGNGVTITPDASKPDNKDKKPVSLTKDGLNNGGNQITNVASGLPKGTDLANADGDTLTNAANIGDLKDATTGLIDTGWKLQTNDGTAETVKLGDTVQVVDGVNTKVSPVTSADGKHTYHVDVTGLPVAYTDEAGELLVKVGDKFYKPDQIDPATGLPKADATESTPAGTTLVNKDGAKDPQTLDGVKSAIDGKDGKDYTAKLDAAATSDPNKAVNVKDLKQATDGVTSAIVTKGLEFAGNTGNFHRDLGQTVTIKGEGTLDDNKYSGENIKTIADKDGNITIKMAKDLKVDNVDVTDKVIVGPKGKDGAPGKDAVVIGKNGKDGVNGISIKGKDGKDAVAINGKDGVGTIGLTGPAGKDGKPAEAIIGVKDGAKGLDGNDGKDGESKTRIVYTKPDNTTEELATLNDGLKYTGDVGNANVKLNKITNITGGVTDKDKLSDNNIGVVAEQNGENADLTIKLAKNLSGLDNVVFGDTKDDGTAKDPTTTVSIGKNGVNAGGKQITNVKSGLGDTKLADAQGDTLTNAANIGDLKNAVSNVTDAANGGGFGLKDQDDNEIKENLGNTVQVIGDNGIETKVVPVDPKKPDGAKALQVGLGNEVSVGKDGKDGSIGVNGADGKSTVAINGEDGGSIVVGGKDGKIGVAGKDGEPGTPGIALNGKDGSIGVAGRDGANAYITTSKGENFLGGKGDDGKDGSDATRITYQPKDNKGDPVGDPKQVATMDDGLTYTGDLGKGAAVKLNNNTQLTGNIASGKTKDDFVDGNIAVVADQDDDDAKLSLKLAKDLKGLNTVTLGDGKPGKDGKPTETSTTIGKDGITINGPKGKDGKVVKLTDKGLDNGGNKITNVADGDISPTSKDAVNGSQLVDYVSKNSSWNISANGKDQSAVKPNSTVDFGSADGSIGVSKSVKDGVTKVDLALGNDLNIGGQAKDGKDGVDGKLAVNGKDGKTGVALNGKDGSIGMKGKDGANATLTVAKGADGVDGKNGANGKDRLKVNGEDVATLNDGVKYEGDQGKAAVKLNQTTKVVGGAKGELTDGNIGVVASQDGKNAKLTVKLAKDLKGLNSVEAKDVTVKKGGNLKVENGANVDMGGNQVKNIASGISGKSYRNPKDNNAANIGDVKAIANQAVAPLNKRINDVDKHASAGTASAMAAAGLPQAYLPGHSMVAVGAGTHRGQNAIAVGVSRISDSGHVVIKLNGATNSKGDTSGSVGVGYQW